MQTSGCAVCRRDTQRCGLPLWFSLSAAGCRMSLPLLSPFTERPVALKRDNGTRCTHAYMATEKGRVSLPMPSLLRDRRHLLVAGFACFCLLGQQKI